MTNSHSRTAFKAIFAMENDDCFLDAISALAERRFWSWTQEKSLDVFLRVYVDSPIDMPSFIFIVVSAVYDVITLDLTVKIATQKLNQLCGGLDVRSTFYNSTNSPFEMRSSSTSRLSKPRSKEGCFQRRH